MSFLNSIFFFFNDTATTEIYTLSLHDALPIWRSFHRRRAGYSRSRCARRVNGRSEEHTSELQSRPHLVCRLLLEKKKNARNKRVAASEGNERVEFNVNRRISHSGVSNPSQECR